MNKDIQAYNELLNVSERQICEKLAMTIYKDLNEAESKIWHAHPVWFIDGNPIVGYSKQKGGVRLMFWSGADFDEENLHIRGKKFKDASIYYNDVSDIIEKDVERWLKKSRDIQWDYKNIVKRKGQLLKLTLEKD